MKNFVDSLQKDIVDFKSLSPQIKFLLAIQVIILFILSILVGVLFSPQFNNQVKRNPNTDLTSALNDKSATQLSIIPQDEIMKVGEERIMSVQMSGAPVTAADIVITYDPTLLEVSNVSNGEIFGREIINNIEAGKITFSAAKNVDDNSQDKDASTGAIFGFAVKALKKVETTRLEFSLDETITAEDGRNTLGVTQSAEIHVFD